VRRIKIFLFWLRGSSDISLGNILRFVFSWPMMRLGKSKLKSISKDGDFYKVQFEGLSGPIYWPQKFDINSLYQVAEELLGRNWWNYEIPENSVHTDDVVLDCGAAEGGFTLQVANRCKMVYAIEPHPAFIEGMKRTFSELSNVEILPVAVGDAKGQLHLSDDGIMSRIDSSNSIVADVDTIDNLFHDRDIRVDFIKADLEGFEVKMLYGAEKTIRKWKPHLSITTYHYANDFANTKEYLERICPEYKIKAVGITDQYGTPIMLHAWVE